MMTHTQCTVLSDSDVMVKMMDDQVHFKKFGCASRRTLSSREFHNKLYVMGYKLLLIHTIGFMELLSPCQLCGYYLGDYPEIDKICVKRREDENLQGLD